MLLGPHKTVLTSFAESHLTGHDEDDALIRLKLDHSMRVLDNAEEIIAGETLNSQTADLCRLAALYHDIGRFPQFAKYKTFNDRDSANHARLGVLALRAIALPDGVPDDQWRIVRFAVGQHNVKSVRSTLPAGLIHPVMVVRDADKLDIFRVLLDHFASDAPQNSVVTHGLEDAPDKYSDGIYTTILAARTGDYRSMRYVNDFKLLLAGWLYELHYRTSLTMAASRHYPERLFALLPETPKIERLREVIFTFINYNAERVS
jgi:putative nucleotidyltransferase with HDIG domain